MTCFLVTLTFVATTAGYAALVYLAWQRVAAHLRSNAAAIAALTEHVLVPLIGSRTDLAIDDESKPDEEEDEEDEEDQEDDEEYRSESKSE